MNKKDAMGYNKETVDKIKGKKNMAKTKEKTDKNDLYEKIKFRSNGTLIDDNRIAFLEKIKSGEIKELKKITVPAGWEETENIYVIYQWNDLLIIRIIEEHSGFGSEWYQCIGEKGENIRIPSGEYISASKSIQIRIEPKEWVPTRVFLRHWEDGESQFDFYLPDTNEAKYMMKWKPKEKNLKVWGDHEYRDYGNIYDDSFYDDMYYKYSVH